MGTWGPSLYSSDTASDLRGMIGAVLKLPFDDEKIVDILCERELELAGNTADEEHPIFWLVLADQFEKRGVVSARVRDKAIAIIDDGSDLAMHEKRGLRGAGLRKRAHALDELKARLAAAPAVSRPRTTLKEPQPYMLELATLYSCPVRGSACVSPYWGPKEFAKWGPWVPDGFRQFIILERGRAFGYLAWYQPIVTIKPVTEKPTLEAARDELWWELDSPKTCPPKHFKAMGIEAIGAVPVDFDKARARFAKTKRGICYLGWDAAPYAVNDVSICDCMNTSSHDWALLLKRGTLPVEGPTVMKNLSAIVRDST